MKNSHLPLPLSLTCLLAALTPLSAAEPSKDTDDSLPIHLGVVENFTTADGSHLTMVLPFFHRFTNPNGSTNSFSILNYLQWPDTTTVLPLFYRTGPATSKHTGLIPLWFQGPNYAGAPLALSGGWTRNDGGQTLWITPLAHLDHRADGSLEDAHVLTYFQGDGYQVLAPLAYRTGTAENRHQGIIPLIFAGPDWWIAPLTLSGAWQRQNGGQTTWITPLFHRSSDQDGATTSLHVLNYIHTPDADVFFPLAWRGGSGNAKYSGVLPLWFQGPGYGCSPALLSAWWGNSAGGTTLWATPLFHTSTDATGSVASFHALTYFHGNGHDVIFPLVWSSRSGVDRSTVVFPLYWQGHDYQVLLPLYYRWGSGDAQQTAVLPFWFQGPNHLVVPPFYRFRDRDGDLQRGVFPLWHQGKDWWVVPPLMTGVSTRADGHTAWITPLFHDERNGTNHTSHLLTWFSGHHGGGTDATTGKPLPESSYQVAFPLFYRTSDTTGDITSTHTGVIPLYFGGPDYWAAPLALSASWNDDDGTNTWMTPLFHRSTRTDGTTSSLHALLYAQSDERGQPSADGKANGSAQQMVFPLFFRTSTTTAGVTNTRTTVFPAWHSSPDCTLIPPLLSAHMTTADGGDSLWATPLFHRNRTKDGTTTSLHALNYIQSGDSRMLFPLAYSSGGTQPHRGIIPLWFDGPEYWMMPAALSGGWTRTDGGTTTWITPLAHVERNKDGRIDRMHALTYYHDHDTDVIFPLAYATGTDTKRHHGIIPLWFDGPEYWTVPAALSGGWTRTDGGTTTWITPLAHVERNKDGRLDRMHALTYYHDRNTDVLFPLAYATGEDTQRHHGIIPLWFDGPEYWTVPIALAGGWRHRGGGHSTWITPLFHHSTDSHGVTTDWHALNLIHSGDTDLLFPLAWRTGPAEQRHSAIFPLFWQGPEYSVLAPLYAQHRESWFAPLALSAHWNNGEDRSTTLVTPLYHRTTDHGKVAHEHVLNYVSTPDFTSVLPLYWDWQTTSGERNRLLIPLAIDHRNADGGHTTSVIPPLLTYRSGKEVSTSLGLKLLPFLWQQADNGYEVNVLWRLFHLREQNATTDSAVWPLWWSEHRPDAPSRWQILGGLVGHENNYDTKTSRFYLFWIPIGERKPFAPTAQHPSPAS